MWAVLFNSPVFIFYFLPAVLLIAGLLRYGSQTLMPVLAFLAVASLGFYAYTEPAWLLIILASVAVNYFLGYAISSMQRWRKPLLIAGIVFNLGLLGYFKYADFLLVNLSSLGLDMSPLGIILPIGISFYTFQQIAYLADVYQDQDSHPTLLQYLVFVSFFPQLIAGPIVHHRELIPQLKDPSRCRVSLDNLTPGAMLFLIGLAKKVFVADTFAQYASPAFASAADAGMVLSTADAWMGVLAYSLQIYFDFSGYSDMAIGLGRMFGLRLPDNFDSPYKSRSIIEFWRRWHMTLSRFLRDYLYIPLGGNRKGNPQRWINLMITMLLGGLWHGAGWGFVLWGALHGGYLGINHAWQRCAPRVGTLVAKVAGWLSMPITFLAALMAWVPFRSASMESTLAFWHAMFVANGEALTLPDIALPQLLAGLGVVFFAPNSQTFMRIFFAQKGESAQLLSAWTRPAFAAVVGFTAALGLFYNNQISEFLYFQF